MQKTGWYKRLGFNSAKSLPVILSLESVAADGLKHITAWLSSQCKVLKAARELP